MNTGEEQRKRKDDFISSQQNADVFKTNAAKTIMDKFNYMGGVAGGNAIAEGASANGGNIDSFSAANRARQQLAYTSAGADAVIAEYQNRMNNIMDTLKSIDSQNANEYSALNNNYNLGQGTAQQMSDNAQLIYNNLNQNKLTDAEADSMNVETEARKSEITGLVTPKISDEYNVFLDENGNVKNLDFDYQARINELEKELENTTDEGKRQSIQLALSWLSRARDKKTSLPEYSQYAGGTKAYPWETAGFKLDKASLADAKEIAMAGYKSNENIATTEAEVQKFIGQLDADTQTAIAEMEKEVGLKTLDLEKYLNENGYTEAGVQKYIIDKYGIDTYNEYFGSDSDEEDEAVEIVTKPTGWDENEYVTDNAKKIVNNYFKQYGDSGSVDSFVSYLVENSASDGNNLTGNNWTGLDQEEIRKILTAVLEDAKRVSEIMGLIENVDPEDASAGVQIVGKTSG